MFTVTASVLPLCLQETIDFSLGLYLDQEVKEFSGSSSLKESCCLQSGPKRNTWKCNHPQYHPAATERFKRTHSAP